MKKLAIAIAIALVVAALPAAAADFNGQIVDGRHGQTHAQYPEKLAGLTAGEVLENQFEGLGLVIEGRYYSLDSNGENAVRELLQGIDPSTRALFVRISGQMQGGSIAVSDLSPRSDGFLSR